MQQEMEPLGHEAVQRTHLPRDVGLPAAPGLAEVLQDGPGLVLLDALGHHVQDVVHDCGAQLKVKVGLNTLLGHRLGHALGVTPCGERETLQFVITKYSPQVDCTVNVRVW